MIYKTFRFSFLTFLIPSLAQVAFALPAPVSAMDPLQRGWPEITLKVDFKNLTGPDEAGKVTSEELVSKLKAVNRVWSQCSVQFSARSVSNVSTIQLGIPYGPKDQQDLSKIAAALNPNGFEAIPLTIAGPWTFFDSGSGLYLTGLGWVFTKEKGIDRIGAMMSSTKMSDPAAGPILAHELAHALSLPHTAEKDNLMGQAGTNSLTLEQCQQARRFSEFSLREFMIGA